MAKELNEDTTFKMSIKTMGMVVAGIAVVVGGWYLKEQILEEIPEAEITRMEFDMKDQMIRQTILTTQSDIEEMKKTLEKIEDKIYNR